MEHHAARVGGLAYHLGEPPLGPPQGFHSQPSAQFRSKLSALMVSTAPPQFAAMLRSYYSVSFIYPKIVLKLGRRCTRWWSSTRRGWGAWRSTWASPPWGAGRGATA